ncbi:MAG: type II toxin-antitoxin system VapB family antitoxin [Luteolibacter sp.]
MRITADIDEAILTDLLKMTGDKSKSAAVARAVKDYVNRQKSKEFGRLIRENAFDYPDTVLDESGHDVANPVPDLYN